MRRALGWARLRLAVLAVVLLSVGPFVWIVLTSLKAPGEIDARPPRLWPSFDLSFYRMVLGAQGLGREVANSALVAGATTLVAVLLGAMAAYPLARLPVRGRRVVLGLVLVAAMFPQVAIVGGVYRLLGALGLLNTHAGLVLPYSALTLPLAIWILVGFFRELPPELEDAARADGCGPWQALWRVIAPLAAPGVFAAAILVFIYAWNEFFFALLIVTDPAVRTLPVGIAHLPGQYRVPWGELAAAGTLATLPLLVAVLLLQRRIVSGLTAGALKG